MASGQLPAGDLPEFWIVPEVPFIDPELQNKTSRKPAVHQIPIEQAFPGPLSASATLPSEDHFRIPLKFCQSCHQGKPLADFQSFRGEVKTCEVCRAKKRAYSHKHYAKVKAQVEAFQRAQENFYNRSIASDISHIAIPNHLVAMTTTVPDQKLLLRLKPREDLSPDVESPTPSTSHQSSPSSDTEDEDAETISDTASSAWFRCLHCGLARRVGAQYSEICLYCLEHEQKFCVFGDHEGDRPSFVGDDGVEYDVCNGCREGQQRGEEVDIAPSE